MSLNVYIEEDFDHDHEATQAADLCRRLAAQIPSDACYTLLLNFYLNGKQLDALLLTPHKFIVIDFKYVNSLLSSLDSNRPWRCVDGYELEGSGYGNPFKQVVKYRRQLGHVLMNCQRELFVDGRIGCRAERLDFGSVMGYVAGGICLGPEIRGQEPSCENCDFPKWFFFGRQQVFAEKCLTICQGEPIVFDTNVHLAFVSCISGLRKAIIGQDGVPKLPRPVRLRQTNDGLAASVVEPDIAVTEDTTADQIAVSIGASIDKGTRCFIISGAAGTGKTTLIKRLIPILEGKGLMPTLMAPTGRAAKMMSLRTERHASTIHSLIYKRPDEPVVDEDGDAVCFVFPLKHECPPSAAIIVDESSMVSLSVQNRELLRFGSGSLLKDLVEYSGVKQEECNNILIFIGDNCQLNPVGESCKTPPALDPEIIRSLAGYEPMTIELKKIHRQSEDSGILEEAMRIRSGLTHGRFDRFRYRAHPDVIICSEDDALAMLKPEEELSEKIIVAQTNSSVWTYNNLVRQRLSRDMLPLAEGERLMSLRNTRVPIGEDGYEEEFMNGDFLHVDALPDQEPYMLTGFYRERGAAHPLSYDFTFRKMTLSWPYEPDKPQVAVWVNISPIVSESWRENSDYASIALYNAVRNLIVKKFPGLSKEELKEKLRNSTLLNAPIVTYGYAITGHKSQGGEWKYVWVDYRYAQNCQTEEYFRWSYTVTTRAKKKLFAIAPPSFDQLVDIFRFEDEMIDLCPNKTVSRPLSQVLVECGYEILRVTELPYRYRVFVKKNGEDSGGSFESRYVDVVFNGKNLVSNVSVHISEMADEAKVLVRSIVGMTIRAAMGGESNRYSQSVARPTNRHPDFAINARHEETAGRIRDGVKHANYTLVSIGSLNEFQLRATVEHPQGTGYFDVYFDNRGRVTKLGTYTLPISVLKMIKEGL